MSVARLLGRLFGREPHRRFHGAHNASSDLCICGYHSPWDYNLRRHFDQMRSTP